MGPSPPLPSLSSSLPCLNLSFHFFLPSTTQTLLLLLFFLHSLSISNPFFFLPPPPHRGFSSLRGFWTSQSQETLNVLSLSTMETRPPVAAKKLRSYLRVAFFMIRKGLTSKRKLIMSMNLMMKRGKFISKGLGNLVFHHHHHHHHHHHRHGRFGGHDYGLQEYEFSCNTSPSPVFFHPKRASRHNYFPCLGADVENDDEPPQPVSSIAAASFPRIHYSPQSNLPTCSPSPSSVSASDYDDEEGVVSRAASPETNEVDNEADLFIRTFYEQLRRQRRVALLQYETDYQDMLARSH